MSKWEWLAKDTQWFWHFFIKIHLKRNIFSLGTVIKLYNLMISLSLFKIGFKMVPSFGQPVLIRYIFLKMYL